MVCVFVYVFIKSLRAAEHWALVWFSTGFHVLQEVLCRVLVVNIMLLLAFPTLVCVYCVCECVCERVCVWVCV